jgi:hypothetical protein
MWGAILAAVQFIWGLIFPKKTGPSQEAIEAQQVGTDQQALQTEQAEVKTETAVADAEAQAPKTQQDVVKSLESGTF